MSPSGQPHVYAGGGFSAKREERAALAESTWPRQTEQAGLHVFSDSDGIYALAGKPLAEIIAEGDTLSAQARLIADWAHTTMASLATLPEPPDLSTQTKALFRSRAQPGPKK